MILVLVAAAVGVLACLAVIGMNALIEGVPPRWLPWSVLALVTVAMLVFGAAAVLRVGALP